MSRATLGIVSFICNACLFYRQEKRVGRHQGKCWSQNLSLDLSRPVPIMVLVSGLYPVSPKCQLFQKTAALPSIKAQVVSSPSALSKKTSLAGRSRASETHN